MSAKSALSFVLLVVALQCASAYSIENMAGMAKDLSKNMDHLSKIFHSLGTSVEVFASFCNSTYKGDAKIDAYLDCHYKVVPQTTLNMTILNECKKATKPAVELNNLCTKFESKVGKCYVEKVMKLAMSGKMDSLMKLGNLGKTRPSVADVRTIMTSLTTCYQSAIRK